MQNINQDLFPKLLFINVKESVILEFIKSSEQKYNKPIYFSQYCRPNVSNFPTLKLVKRPAFEAIILEFGEEIISLNINTTFNVESIIIPRWFLEDILEIAKTTKLIILLPNNISLTLSNLINIIYRNKLDDNYLGSLIKDGDFGTASLSILYDSFESEIIKNNNQSTDLFSPFV